jgi:4-hydroxybenzoate polyprenyltransferase
MAFTQYMVRYCVLIPTLNLQAHDLEYSLLTVQMTEFDFFLLTLSTMFIGAAGYIINDYFDVSIDRINRPNSNVVGKSLKRRIAMISHIIINFIGVSLGIYLSWKYNFLRLGAMIFISAPLLLWFYSTNLKRRFLIGNLVIALLSGIVPMVVVLFEIPLIYKTFPNLISNNSLDLSGILTVVQFIALFAFVTTLMREIIKDLEDYEGDIEYGCKTMPIVLGVAPTKIILVIILGLVIMTLGWLQYLQLKAEDWTSLIYFSVLLQMPLFYLTYRILTSKGKKDWRFASIAIKFIMVAGISFLFLYAHQIQKLIVS